MNLFSKKRVVGILAVGIVFFSLTNSASAEERTLNQDTKLYPQGWSVGEQIKFKKDTRIETNEFGEVEVGVLAGDTYLRPRGWGKVINDYYYASAYADISPFFFRYPYAERRYNIAVPTYGHLRYKGGTEVAFSAEGDVLSGTIDESAAILLMDGKYGFVNFRKGSILTFYDAGMIKAGTLADDTNLRPVGWNNNLKEKDKAGFLKFKAKEIVEFNDKGLLVKGTLKEKTVWQQPSGMNYELPADKIISFNADSFAEVQE